MTTDRHMIEGISGIAYGSTEDSDFTVDEWGLYDWSMMLSNYPTLEDLSEAASKAAVDARETFFARSGYEPRTDTLTGKAWEAILNTPAWNKAKSQAKSQFDKAALLNSMLRNMGGRVLYSDKQEDAIEDLPEDFSIEDLVSIELPEADNVPTEEEIEDGEATMAFVRIVAPGMGGDTKADVLEEALALASRIDLGTFKDLLGFAAKVVKGASRKAASPRGEMIGYESTSWSDKVITTDMIGVAQGNLEALTRLAEGQLTARSFESDLPMGKGPIVMLRDETGSMKYGHSHAPALSLEVALANAFNSDGRDLVTIAWGGKRHTSGSETRRFTWGDPGLDRHLRAFLDSGSTKLYEALIEALDVAAEYVPGSDILIQTDGMIQDIDRLKGILIDGDSGHDFGDLRSKVERFRDEGGRIWVIVLGEHVDLTDWEEKLPIADGAVHIDSVTAGEGLEEIIGGMSDRSDSNSLAKRFVY